MNKKVNRCMKKVENANEGVYKAMTKVIYSKRL